VPWSPGLGLCGHSWVICNRTTENTSSARLAESQLTELRNMRVLLEEARVLARDLAYHRRARLEDVLGRALDEVDQHIEELRREERRS
jgi:hypothetical protein